MALFDLPWLTEPLKKVTIKYLIHHYLGNFLDEELSLDQLNFELFQGRGSITNIPLNVTTINELVTPFVPLKLLDGCVDNIELSVPWSSLIKDSCEIVLDGVRLDFAKLDPSEQIRTPLSDATGDTSTSHHSNSLSRSLMTTSMEMAEEIMQQESEKFDGLEMFAKLIDSVIRRFKVAIRNTVIKVK